MSQRSVVAAASLLLAVIAASVHPSAATFSAVTSAPASTVGMDALVPPSTLSATPVGDAVTVTWSGGGLASGASTHGFRVGRSTPAVEAGTRDGLDAPTCGSSTAFSTLVDVGAGTTSTVDVGAPSSPGSFVCYRAQTRWPAPPSTARWFSQTGTPVTATMLGNVVRSVELANGAPSTNGVFGEGDRIVLTFNQPVSTTPGQPSSANGFCVNEVDGVIHVGRTATNPCSKVESVVVGSITGVTASPRRATPAYGGTWVWSGCVETRCSVLTGTVGARTTNGGGDASITGGSPIFTPSSSSAAATSAGGVPLCVSENTATSTCRPTPFDRVPPSF